MSQIIGSHRKVYRQPNILNDSKKLKLLVSQPDLKKISKESQTRSSYHLSSPRLLKSKKTNKFITTQVSDSKLSPELSLKQNRSVSQNIDHQKFRLKSQHDLIKLRSQQSTSSHLLETNHQKPIEKLKKILQQQMQQNAKEKLQNKMKQAKGNDESQKSVPLMEHSQKTPRFYKTESKQIHDNIQHQELQANKIFIILREHAEEQHDELLKRDLFLSFLNQQDVKEMIKSDINEMNQEKLENQNSQSNEDHSRTLKESKHLESHQNLVNPMKFSKDRSEFIKKYQLAEESLESIRKEDYFRCYKNLNKFEDFQQLYCQEQNIYLALLKSQRKYNLIPKSLNIVQDTQQINKINAHRTVQLPQYGDMLIDGIKNQQCKNIKSLDLSQNQINSPRLQNILTSMSVQLVELNLSKNQIDSYGIKELAQYISKPNCALKILNLEQNKLSDQGCIELLNFIPDNSSLQILNLSQNKLTNISSESISQYIKRSNQIQELYLHFNNLDQDSGENIFRSLVKNQNLCVLDLSYNQLGVKKKQQKNNKSQKISECAEQLSKFLIKNKSRLVHLDLSYNRFNIQDTKEISLGLSKNQTVYGFHFQGNQLDYEVECRGFLVNQKDIQQKRNELLDLLQQSDEKFNDKSQIILDETNQKGLQIENQIMNEYKFNNNFSIRRIKSTLPIQNKFKQNGIVQDDVCWICDGWQEVIFKWTPHKSGSMLSEPIFIHIDFLEFRPLLMTKLNDEFQLYKICPPNQKVQYFFSNPLINIYTIAKDQHILELQDQNILQNEKQKYLYNDEILYLGQSMRFVNFINTNKKLSIVIDPDKFYLAQVLTKPREDEPKYEFTPNNNNPMVYNGKIWTIEKSIFKNYQPDNDTIIADCFDFDIQHSKISRLVKENEIEIVKQTLKKYYYLLFNAYKYYASMNVGSNIPCISMNSFQDFLSSTIIVDGQKIRYTDIELSFISTNAKDLQYPQVHEKALVRYQWLEVLLRISIDKYYKTNVCQTINDAVERLFQNDLVLYHLQQFDKIQEWRTFRFWKEECDILIKRNLQFFKLIFKFTSKINSKQQFTSNIWVSSKDFRDLLNICQLFSESLLQLIYQINIFKRERDAYLAFLLSITTQVDELFHPRHYQMNFYEFIEALARVADKISLYPIKSTASFQDIHNIEVRRQKPLYQKLLGLLLLIFYSLGDTIQRQNNFSDESKDLDFYLLGSKRSKIYRNQVQKKLQDLTTKKNNQPYLPTLPMENSSQGSENENMEQENQFDGFNQKKILLEMLKFKTTNNNPYEQRRIIKNNLTLFQLVKDLKKTRAEKIKEGFQLVNIVNYFKTKENEFYNQAYQQIEEQKQ